MRLGRTAALALTTLLATAVPASAHVGHPAGDDLVAGAVHPFTGLDHLLAMLTVGLLAARLGGRNLWLLPTLFVAGMAAGGAAAVLAGGHAVGGVEQVIAASVVAFGLMLVAVGRLPTGFALAAVPAFAAFHGFAHLVEGAGDAGHGPVTYAVGMMAASAVLHGVGIVVGRLMARRGEVVRSTATFRIAGGAMALAGVVLFVQTF